MENLNWLFWAYGVGWTIIFLYLFQIGRRESALRRKVADLQAMMEEKWKK
jgi:CcmD family protein